MKYTLLKQCKADINSVSISGDAGDSVTLNEHEYTVLLRGCYVEKVEYVKPELTYKEAAEMVAPIEQPKPKKRGRKKKDN